MHLSVNDFQDGPPFSEVSLHLDGMIEAPPALAHSGPDLSIFMNNPDSFTLACAFIGFTIPYVCTDLFIGKQTASFSWVRTFVSTRTYCPGGCRVSVLIDRAGFNGTTTGARNQESCAAAGYHK
jgi:hypothetical protein